MTGEPGAAPELPLYRRFPALRRVPRVALATLPTPVQAVDALAPGQPLWLKRDDLSGQPLGGNKVRALEFLLAGVRPGDMVLTVGGAGSTHALATALYAAGLGARTTVVRWRQEMNPHAAAVRARLGAAARCIEARSAALGLARAWLMRAGRGAGGPATLHWVPPGGTSPVGMLGHVNAALELGEQIAAGALPPPARVVVPLGSGGTAAGLALGFAAAALAMMAREDATSARRGPTLLWLTFDGRWLSS